jgi:hypothetical protein
MKKQKRTSKSFRITFDLQYRIERLENKNIEWLKSESTVITSSLEKALSLVELLEKYQLLERAGLQFGAEKIIEKECSKNYKATIRMPNSLLERIEAIAIKRGAGIHHTSNKINLSPTIVYLIELGLGILEFRPTNLPEILMLNPPRREIARAFPCQTDPEEALFKLNLAKIIVAKIVRQKC